MPPYQESKGALLEFLRESKPKSEEIAREAGDLQQWARYMADLSEAGERALRFSSTADFDWRTALNVWEYVNQLQDSVLANIESVHAEALASSGSAATYVVAPFARVDLLAFDMPIEQKDEAYAAAEQLGQVIDRFADRTKTMSLLRQFGLESSSPGAKSPMELFEIAWAAFDRPVTPDSPVVTSLIPMRECINATIAVLLRRRSRQEPARPQYDKIISIGSQLAWDGISPMAIQSLAQRWAILVDELSGAKQQHHSREEWHDLLRRATLYLTEFLQTLNPAKMR